MQGIWRFLREADWLTAKRVRGYCLILLIASVASVIWFYNLAMTNVGSDFQAFWGAANVALNHGFADAYDLEAQARAQQQLGRREVFAFVNPPPFLLLMIPFGAIPYHLAWIAWVVIGYTVWAAVAIKLYPRLWPLVVAFPGGLIAAIHAQNGFVTGALMISGAALVSRKPWLGGALIGALIIKPHLALLFPFWLAAGSMWRAFVAAGISVICLLGLSWLIMGTDTMIAYTDSWRVSANLLQTTPDEFYLRMATVYGQLRVHLGETAALTASLIVTLGMILLVMLSWQRFGDNTAAGGALVLAATPLASPYLFNYDLAFLILPILWLTAEGLSRGFAPWEKLILLALYISPFASRALALPLELNLMPFASAALVALVWKRGAELHRQSGPAVHPA